MCSKYFTDTELTVESRSSTVLMGRLNEAQGSSTALGWCCERCAFRAWDELVLRAADVKGCDEPW